MKVESERVKTKVVILANRQHKILPLFNFGDLSVEVTLGYNIILVFI